MFRLATGLVIASVLAPALSALVLPRDTSDTLQAKQATPSTRLRGLDSYMRVPDDNPLTPGRIALGRRLFFDKRLSADESLACATCHAPESGFADHNPVAIGIGGRRGTRNAPALLNRGWGGSFFWDGRVTTLEATVLEPIANPDELGASVEMVVDRLARDEASARAFLSTFGRPVNAEDLAFALASYVRSIQAGDSTIDRYRDRAVSLTRDQRLGLRVFGGRGLCITCHVGPTFSDEAFHNTGVAGDGTRFLDRGRAAVTGQDADTGAFRTPSLRQVADTAPYMHDGSLATLEDVVEFYDGGGRANPYLDSEILRLGLSPEEKAALVTFLRALSGIVAEANQVVGQRAEVASGFADLSCIQPPITLIYVITTLSNVTR